MPDFRWQISVGKNQLLGAGFQISDASKFTTMAFETGQKELTRKIKTILTNSLQKVIG